MRVALIAACATAAALIATPAAASCTAAAAIAARLTGVPAALLVSVAQVESGLHPWTLNVDGRDVRYTSHAAALEGLRRAIGQGARNVDGGCWQVSSRHHGQANAELALDPLRGALYAALYLTDLRARTGTWTKATQWYHNRDTQKGEPYADKVTQALTDLLRRHQRATQHASR